LRSAHHFGGTFARLVTRGIASWIYSFFKIRAKLPGGQGTWPSICTLGVGDANSIVWPDDGEIDIMEFVGSKAAVVLATVHNAKYN
jgi:beta-glucanase (GH16 family)